jgi:hypothetical protein
MMAARRFGRRAGRRPLPADPDREPALGHERILAAAGATLVRARHHARRVGCDALLAAPQQQVLRMLSITRINDVFAVHACVDEAAGSVGGPLVATMPRAGSSVLSSMP